MSTVVHVQNIASQTSEKEVRDFFSFCGKITNLSVTPQSGDANSAQTATVTFEKETAAKTALLLDNTQLGPSQVHVTAGQSLDQAAAAAGSTATGESGEELTQEDKPRSRIFAEYLAHGYVLSDGAIQKALELDNKHGVSNRFTSALHAFDQKFQATDKAKGIDNKFGLTGHAQTGFNTLHSYYEKAVNTPTGQKLASLYVQGEKQVLDVHNEARRLADLKGGKANVPQPAPGDSSKTVCQCGGDDGNCPCEAGKCNCSGCPKSSLSGANVTHPAPGDSSKTVCQCAGNDGNCPCEPGKCNCTGCSKSSQKPGQAAATESAQAAVDGKNVPRPTGATDGAAQTTGNV